MPESLWRIEGNAFSGCFNLKSVDLTHVTSIGDYAFKSCSLTEVRIPEGITSVSYGAFSECRKLKSLILHDGVTVIDSYAFSGCVSLTAVHLPEQVQIVSDSAFFNCGNLSDLKLNEGLEIIGNHAFGECTKLETVMIPDTVIKIEAYAFVGCEDLKEVILGAGVSEIDVCAFQGCKKLSAFRLSDKNTSFHLHQGVLYSGDKKQLMLMPDGFSGEYIVPAGTTSIARRACYGSGLCALTIPGSVAEVGEYAFDNCENLATVILENGIRILHQSAFAEIPIREITIPKSVTKIENQAFSWCKKLAKITFEGAPPEIEEIAFSLVTADVYRPGHIDEWKKAEKLYGGLLEWKRYCAGVHVPAEPTVKEPTCTEKGMVGEIVCINCGEGIEKQKEIPAAGHKFGDWVEDTPPTTQKEGAAKRVCMICGTQEQKVLEKLPQDTTEPEPSTQATEPEPSTQFTEPDHSAGSGPTEIEPPTTALPAQSEPLEQGQSDGVKWGAIAAVAIVSLLTGLIVAAVIYGHRKNPKTGK